MSVAGQRYAKALEQLRANGEDRLVRDIDTFMVKLRREAAGYRRRVRDLEALIEEPEPTVSDFAGDQARFVALQFSDGPS